MTKKLIFLANFVIICLLIPLRVYALEVIRIENQPTVSRSLNPEPVSLTPTKLIPPSPPIIVSQPLASTSIGQIKIESKTGESSGSVLITTDHLQVSSTLPVSTDQNNQLIVSDPQSKIVETPILNPESIKLEIPSATAKITLEKLCLDQTTCQPVYKTEIDQPSRFAGLIPISYPSSIIIDATNAHVVSQTKPWYVNFLPFLFR